MNEVKRFYFSGMRGTIGQRSSVSLAELTTHHHGAPRVEMLVEDDGKLPKEPIEYAAIPDKEAVLVRLMAAEAYQKVGRYGFFGDVVRVSRYAFGTTYGYIVDQVGQLAFDKPGLAADILPFIRDIDGNLYFVCIRKETAGKGPYSLVGGFVDSAGMRMETFAETAAREAGEEITLRIWPSGYGVSKIRDPLADDIPVIVEFRNGESVASALKLVKTCFTSTSTREREAGCKRVHMTTAYMTVIEIGRVLTGTEILRMLDRDSDAAEVVVLSSREFASADFKRSHHREIFDSALKILNA